MRTIVRLLLVVAVLAIGAVVILNYWPGSTWQRTDAISSPTVGTSGVIDKEQAREVGAKVGETAAVATEKVVDAAHDAAITMKIKAKMALDDMVKARHVDVTTNGSTVTLSGVTESVPEHDRAMALARETDGVSQVIDRLDVPDSPVARPR